jgi:DNA-binding MarR family transcriptional regulator
MDHDDNVVGAAMLLVADRLREAVEAATGHRGAHPAALTALHGWADGSSIETLARGLGLSHSRTVRVVDALVDEGLAVRAASSDDARQVLVQLTGAGTRAAVAVLAARADVLDGVLDDLPEGERKALAAAAETILASTVESRADARLTCRLCDLGACGHRTGECPVTRAADEAERQDDSAG